jgi:hypothetical protein
MTASDQTRQIFLNNGICVHFIVHRRTDEDGRGCGKQDRGQEIVGDPRGHLADGIGRRRGDDDQFGELGQGNMVDFEAPVQPEKVPGNPLAG